MAAIDNLQPLQFELPIKRILKMRYADAEVLPRPGKFVKHALKEKQQHIANGIDDNKTASYYNAVRESLAKGQTAPLGIGRDDETGEEYLINGGHRVALAMGLGMKTMKVARDSQLSTDREFDKKHKQEGYW